MEAKTSTLPRLALVGPIPPPAGGMANQTAQLKRLLEAEGMAVELVAVNGPYWPDFIGAVPGLRAVARLLAYVPRLWSAFGRAEVVHLMANSGWSWHLFAAPAILVARLRGKPLVVNYRGGYAEDFLGAQGRYVLPVLRKASALAVPSGFLDAVFSRYGAKARIIPNIVDRGRFFPAENPAAVPHLVVTRNLEPIYDIPTALRAFARLKVAYPEARLTVAGTGPELENLQALARELGIVPSVDFCGRLEPEAIAALYRRATLMLNPSTVDNMPNSILEALACGVPVVSTDVGGVPFVVEDRKTALLVPPGDPAAMAAACLALLGEAGLAEGLRERGLAAVAAYEWPVVKGQWLALYRELAGHGGLRPPA
ncbi:MAG: glycosyltransferase family 4 protein [Gammaproteobacteria bacterium]|nr:glycosyltransferase family 4 protein [Gammaproteobacteria bacterium]